MKILLIGATGNVGQRILKEALDKGYQVTAAQRNSDASQVVHPRLTLVKGDLLDEAGLPQLLQGQDLIISAISPVGGLTPDQFKKANQHLITALQQQPGKRIIIVGGAGSTEVSPGLKLKDSAMISELPQAWKPAILIHDEVLELYKASGLNWTYFSPANHFVAGERTGIYKLGTTNMIFDTNGDSKISFEDYAVALVDEIKNEQAVKQQLTIGY